MTRRRQETGRKQLPDSYLLGKANVRCPAERTDGQQEDPKNRRIEGRRITLEGWRDAGLRLPEAGDTASH